MSDMVIPELDLKDDELLDHLRRTYLRRVASHGSEEHGSQREARRALITFTEVVNRHQQVADTKGHEGASMFWRTGGGYRNPPNQGEPTP